VGSTTFSILKGTTIDLLHLEVITTPLYFSILSLEKKQNEPSALATINAINIRLTKKYVGNSQNKNMPANKHL
jgi:hypothetical protein